MGEKQCLYCTYRHDMSFYVQLMEQYEDNLIERTRKEFQPYYDSALSDTDFCEIVVNFTGFAKLLLKLEQKRQEALGGAEI